MKGLLIMSQIVFRGCIDDEFFGYDEDAVFKMSDGSFWHQAQYEYWYYYEYMPKAIISYDNGHYYLTVAEKTILIEQLYDVIEDSIDGVFNGWDNKKRYRLTNGQVWEQTDLTYEYAYEYKPSVLIYSIYGEFYMRVGTTKARVRKVSSH